MAQTRYRMRFDFQLNIAKADEYSLAETIGWLKKQKLYSKTIRDGIRLICDLRSGNLNVLFELFPWVRAEFLEYMASVAPQKSETELLLADQLTRIETLLSDGSTNTNGGGGPKQMTVPARTGPEPVDDEVGLSIRKAASDGKSAQNFLNSAFSLLG